MTERQALNLLMEAKGDFLAASAHEGYCSGGRGLVLVEGTTLAYLPLEIVRNLPPDLACVMGTVYRMRSRATL